MARIKIDVSAGILEVEGDEKFLTSIYEDFKGRLQVRQAIQPTDTPKKIDKGKAQSQKKTTNSKVGARKESYAFVKDLDLRGSKEGSSLRTFFDEKSPNSAMEMTTVFVYYLEKIAHANPITLDHIYTCYKEVGKKVPTALKQNLLDTAHRKGTVDTSSLDDIKLTTRGENMVELDLKRDQKSE